MKKENLFYNNNLYNIDSNKSVHAPQYHWIGAYGYGNYIDNILSAFVGGNSRSEEFEFSAGCEDYALWMWMGDYAWYGAEIGIYKGPSKLGKAIGDTNYGSVGDIRLPMTLNLYEQTFGVYNNHFNWAPTEDQWWINGFIPDTNWYNKDKKSPHQAKNMVTIGTIDFSKTSTKRNMYDELRKEAESDPKKKDFIVFDDTDCMAWVIWWGEGVYYK